MTPVFFIMLVISFTLWYITKLSYSYTTDFNLELSVSGENIVVGCVLEGKGTNLLHYFMSLSKMEIDLSEVNYSIKTISYSYDAETETTKENKVIVIKPSSLKSFLSVRFSDIKVISIGDIPEIPYTK